METKAHYALVGFFAIALLAAGALFAVWLGQVRFDQEFKEFDVVFQGPVRGLTQASEVRFSGIQVGEVTRLRLDETDPSQVVARIRITEQTPVSRDSYAQLEPQGLTGLNYIQLNPGPPDSDPLVSRPGEIPRLSSRQAQLESLISSSEDIAVEAEKALLRINAVLSPDNVEALSEVIASVAAISSELARGDEEALLPRVRSTLAELETAIENVNALAETDLPPLLEEATRATSSLADTAEVSADIARDMRAPLTRFSNEGLDELTLAIADLRRLIAEIEAIAAGVEENPAAFVAGGRRQEVEIPR